MQDILGIMYIEYSLGSEGQDKVNVLHQSSGYNLLSVFS